MLKHFGLLRTVRAASKEGAVAERELETVLPNLNRMVQFMAWFHGARAATDETIAAPTAQPKCKGDQEMAAMPEVVASGAATPVGKRKSNATGARNKRVRLASKKASPNGRAGIAGYCTQCGFWHSSEHQFCKTCGAPIDEFTP